MEYIRSFAIQAQRFLLSRLQYNTSHLPRWRRPLVGYLMSVCLIIGSLTLDLIGRSSQIPRASSRTWTLFLPHHGDYCLFLGVGSVHAGVVFGFSCG